MATRRGYNRTTSPFPKPGGAKIGKTIPKPGTGSKKYNKAKNLPYTTITSALKGKATAKGVLRAAGITPSTLASGMGTTVGEGRGVFKNTARAMYKSKGVGSSSTATARKALAGSKTGGRPSTPKSRAKAGAKVRTARKAYRSINKGMRRWY